MLTLAVVVIEARTSSADEIWVPTYQQDTGGGGTAPRVGTPGVTYLSVVGYASPNTATDHFVGLRFSHSPK